MEITYYKAKCKEDIKMPKLGSCEKGKTYVLDQWDAMYWGAAFDIKGAETWTETKKMDDKSQAEVEAEIEKKEKAEAARRAAMTAPNAEQVEQKKKTRPEVVGAMGAGLINDLLASYDLPKLATKGENVELVLKYEEALGVAEKLTPEERLKALEEFGIEKPETGKFDEASALARAIAMQDLDTDEGNPRNQKAKDKAEREAKKGKSDAE